MKVEDEDIMYFNTFFFYYIYSWAKERSKHKIPYTPPIFYHDV